MRKRIGLLDACLEQDRLDRHEHRIIQSTFPNNNNNQLAVLNGILANQPLIRVSHPFLLMESNGRKELTRQFLGRKDTYIPHVRIQFRSFKALWFRLLNTQHLSNYSVEVNKDEVLVLTRSLWQHSRERFTADSTLLQTADICTGITCPIGAYDRRP